MTKPAFPKEQGTNYTTSNQQTGCLMHDGGHLVHQLINGSFRTSGWVFTTHTHMGCPSMGPKNKTLSEVLFL